MSIRLMPVFLLLAALAMSCQDNGKNSPSLSSGRFQPAANDPGSDASSLDRGGAIRTPPPADRNGHTPEPPRAVSPVVEQQVQPPGGEVSLAGTQPATGSAAGPTTGPSTSPSAGTYMTLGGVVAEVGSTPIYAHKVMAVLRGPLSTEAPHMTEKQFRSYARDILGKEVQNFIRAELEFEAANRNLSPEDKDLAEGATIVWRKKKVTEAGGSLELARRRAAAEGFDFEELVQQQHRLEVTRIYYTRKLLPRVQITGNDIRAYYNRHLEAEFTEHDQVHFRLIKIDPKKLGSKDAALEKAKSIQERAVRGEDFAKMAREENSDTYLAERSGDYGWIGKGLKMKELEAAIWALQPGEATPVVQEGDAFYVAKLEARKKGLVRSFEDQAVQEKIRNALHAEQFAALRQASQDDLMKKNIWTINKDMMNTMLEMVVQVYKK